MRKILYKQFVSHASLLVIILGAGCFLLTNLVLREFLSDYNYGKYSIVATCISIVYLYGLLGYEQVFIRFSNAKDKNLIQTQKTQLYFLIGITITSSFTFFIIYLNTFQKEIPINPILLFLSIFCLIISPILFNIFRLNSEFSVAQLVQNGWKIGFVFISLAFYLMFYDSITNLIYSLLSLIILITIATVIYLKQKIQFVYDNTINHKKNAQAFFLFFISISSFSLVMFGDRFIIESKLGTIVFGDYFYLSNIILAPFSILQNYVGFKQVVYFKENFSLDGFKRFNRQILYLALGLCFLLLGFIAILVYFDFLNFDFLKYKTIIGLMFLLGIVRLHSSSILPAFEVKTNLDTLKKANIWVISITLIITIFVLYIVNSLWGIILGFILIWLCRSLIYRNLLIRQINKSISSN